MNKVLRARCRHCGAKVHSIYADGRHWYCPWWQKLGHKDSITCPVGGRHEVEETT